VKIWYLTRSFYPYQKGGGPLLRLGQVKALEEKGWDISVVMPNYGSNKLNIENNIIQIPLNYNIKINSYLERLGLSEDYLDKWVKKAFKYLKNKIKKDDIIFATSGGELGMIKLASLLKDEIGCKFVVNFHDPLDYSIVNGLKLDKKFHISREKQEYKYLKNSDLIITSSKYNKNSLQMKYPKWENKIKNNYFGYIKEINLKEYKKIKSKKLRVAYVGNMGDLQKPEILYNIFKNLNNSNIEIFFIGDSKSYKPLNNIADFNVNFIDFIPHSEFLKFMVEFIDVGFVSLTNDYLGACVPSKIYEYINLGLPMIGALPDGDGKDIINKNGYGLAYNYNDIDNLSKALENLTDKNYLEKIKLNILKDKKKWSMKNRIKEIDIYLKELIYEN